MRQLLCLAYKSSSRTEYLKAVWQLCDSMKSPCFIFKNNSVIINSLHCYMLSKMGARVTNIMSTFSNGEGRKDWYLRRLSDFQRIHVQYLIFRTPKWLEKCHRLVQQHHANLNTSRFFIQENGEIHYFKRLLKTYF